jgi:hypothetical protein
MAQIQANLCGPCMCNNGDPSAMQYDGPIRLNVLSRQGYSFPICEDVKDHNRVESKTL